MDKFFVTGAMGFIGSHWCEYLLKQGKIVYGLDLSARYPKLLEYDNFIFIHDTIKNESVFTNVIPKVDCVCHFAGIADPRRYVTEPRNVIDVTAIAGIKLIEMCRFTDKLFFFTSTSEIYGKNPKVPFHEDDDRVLGHPATQRWCYSTSKALLEHYLGACAHSRELNYVTVRLFNVYGPRLKDRVVGNFIDRIVDNEPLLVHGDGGQTRSFTYIDDVIDAFDKLLNEPNCLNNVFNIGNPTETTILELAEALKSVSPIPTEIEFQEHLKYYKNSYEDIARRTPDISRIRELAGWEPTTQLDEGLRKCLEYAMHVN